MDSATTVSSIACGTCTRYTASPALAAAQAGRACERPASIGTTVAPAANTGALVQRFSSALMFSTGEGGGGSGMGVPPLESGVTCSGNRDLFDDFGIAVSPTTGLASITYSDDQPGNTGSDDHTAIATQTGGPRICGTK